MYEFRGKTNKKFDLRVETASRMVLVCNMLGGEGGQPQ